LFEIILLQIKSLFFDTRDNNCACQRERKKKKRREEKRREEKSKNGYRLLIFSYI